MKNKFLAVSINFNDRPSMDFICADFEDIGSFILDEICDDDGCYFEPKSVVIDFVNYYHNEKKGGA